MPSVVDGGGCKDNEAQRPEGRIVQHLPAAALAPVREDRALLPGTEARPADILLPHWTGGRDTALDITVINPLQLAYVNKSAANAGHALRKAY